MFTLNKYEANEKCGGSDDDTRKYVPPYCLCNRPECRRLQESNISKLDRNIDQTFPSRFLEIV